MVFVFIMTITLKAFFRSITAAFTDPAPATAAAGILMLFLVLYTGYPIPVPSMISALSWITYINVSATCVSPRARVSCSVPDSLSNTGLRRSWSMSSRP